MGAPTAHDRNPLARWLRITGHPVAAHTPPVRPLDHNCRDDKSVPQRSHTETSVGDA